MSNTQAAPAILYESIYCLITEEGGKWFRFDKDLETKTEIVVYLDYASIVRRKKCPTCSALLVSPDFCHDCLEVFK